MFHSHFSVFLAVATMISTAQPPETAQNLPEIADYSQVPAGLGLLPGSVSVIYLCRFPDIQTELNMTDSQKKRFSEIDVRSTREAKRSRAEYDKSLRELGENPSIEARRSLLPAQSAAYLARETAAQKDLRKILDSRQYTRLQQIRYQAEGTNIFKRPEVLEKLLLEPQDAEKIMAILAESTQELIQTTRVPRDVIAAEKKRIAAQEKNQEGRSKEFQEGFKEYEKNVSKLRSQMMQKIAKVLSKGQRARFDKLVGEPFDFSKTWGKPLPLPPVVTDAETKDTNSTAGK